MYLADHGVPARWGFALGDDPFGRRICAEVATSGVDTSGLRTDRHRPTGLLVKDPGADGTRVHYYRRGSAASALTPDLWTTMPCAPPRSSTSAASPRRSRRAAGMWVTALLEPAIGERPCPVSFDVNHRAALWTDGTAASILLGLARPGGHHVRRPRRGPGLVGRQTGRRLCRAGPAAGTAHPRRQGRRGERPRLRRLPGPHRARAAGRGCRTGGRR